MPGIGPKGDAQARAITLEGEVQNVIHIHTIEPHLYAARHRC